MTPQELIAQLGHWDATARERAAEALVNSGAAAVAPLVNGLEHPTASVRGQAALCLGRIGDRRALLPLLESASKLSAGDDRTYCVRAAVDLVDRELRDDPALGDFFAALTRDGDYFVRALACRALGKIGNPRALSVLKRLERDRESWVRESASAALGDLVTAEAARAAAQAATPQPQPAAPSSTTPSALASTTDALDSEPIVPVIRRLEDLLPPDDLVASGDGAIDEAALSVSGEAPMAAVVEPEPPPPSLNVAEVAARLFSREPTTRELAAHDLAEAGPRTLDGVMAVVEAPGRTPNVDVLGLLGRLGDARAAPYLGRVGLSPGFSPDLRAVALRALANVAVGNEKGLLDGLLEKPGPLQAAADPYVRAAACAALGAYRSIRAVRALLDLLSDRHDLVREEAALAIGRAATAAVPDLVDALTTAMRKERDARVQSALLLSIRHAITSGAIDADSAARGAKALMEESREGLQGAALQLAAAAARPNTDTVRAAIEGMKSSNRVLALTACEVVSKLVPTGFGPAVELLTKLASSADRPLSTAAILALGEVGGSTAAGTLRQLRADADPEVADAAREALLRLPPFDVEIKPLRW